MGSTVFRNPRALGHSVPKVSRAQQSGSKELQSGLNIESIAPAVKLWTSATAQTLWADGLEAVV